jgi:DNA-binding beta-propeller fold protein YncE
VSVLDLDARRTLSIIPVSPQIQRISLSVDDSLVFTSDVTKPQLAVIDTATSKIKTWVQLPGLGYGTAPTADGRWLIVALPLIHQVAAVDLSSFKVAHTIDVPTRPQEVIVSPDSTLAYVSCDQSGKVAVISVADWKVKQIIDAGTGADGLAYAVAR